MTVTESRSKVWGHHAGLYTFVSLIYFYFALSGIDWDIDEGDNAKDMALKLQQKLNKIGGCTNDFADVRSQIKKNSVPFLSSYNVLFN